MNELSDTKPRDIAERAIQNRLQRGLAALGIYSVQDLESFLSSGSLSLLEDLLRARGGYGVQTREYMRNCLDNPEQAGKLFQEELTEQPTVDGLSDKERFVIDHHWGLHGNDRLTLKSIGKKIGLSRERVRQIRNVAIKRLKWLEWTHDRQTASLTDQAYQDIERLKALRYRDKAG